MLSLVFVFWLALPCLSNPPVCPIGVNQNSGFFGVHTCAEMVMDHFTLKDKKEVAVACD
jgi:hypothetical protein